jgi:acetylglutamate kinase
MQDLIAKAATLLEALPYIQKFSGATFVIKYGGSFMDSPDPALRNGVARDLVFLEAVEINPVVVHGGGKAITRAMEAAGLKADFVRGQRVTDEAAIRIVDDVCRERSIRRLWLPSIRSEARPKALRARHFPLPQAPARRQGEPGRNDGPRLRG